MNTLLADPDAKINMSLDEIIRLTRGENQLHGRNLNMFKKKKKLQRRELLAAEHSVPLLSSPGGVDIYVSKQSPLLNAENRRRIAQAVSNRAVNSALIQKSKEIIPAEYKLVKTIQGVERVLVPATDYLSRPPRRKLLQPRKLNKTSSSSESDGLVSDKPPPLVAAPLLQLSNPSDDMKMEVDEPDIVVLESPKQKKQFEVIDVESDLPVNLLDGKKVSIPGPLSVPQSCGRTLNDRFTMLIGNYES